MMKQIPNYEGYFATKGGRIWSNRSNKFLKNREDRKGYFQVSLPHEGKFKNRFVHQLVLETYVGQHGLGIECRHLDGNPKNNNLKNLKWGTKKENGQDTRKHGRLLGKGSKLTQDEVEFIRWVYPFKIFSYQKIADFFKISVSNVGAIITNVNWKHCL